LGTGTLIDTFDGSTPAVPGVAAPDMGFDLSTTGFLVVSNAAHPSPGTGISYYATYPHLFRDGVVTMRFRPGDPSLGAKYALFLWAAADLADFTEVQLDGDEITVIGWSAGGLVGAATVSFPEGTFDPAGFNELRVQAFDGNLEVALNGISLGAEFHDPAPLHEGILGFSLLAKQSGSEMMLDEFRVETEIP
jgi:pimeloyl-ACP methyl ester carboxylesterase